MIRLIVGCGYLGLRVAERWQAQGDRVIAVTRSEERAQSFAKAGLEPLVADVTKTETLSKLPAADTLLYAVGYDRRSGESIETVYANGLRNVLQRLPQAPARAIYISTTGVYGDAGGEWVDEQTPCSPTRPGGIASLAAENILRSSACGDRAIVLRLAGIYGPGRVPHRELIVRGEPIPAPSEGHLNLIHVEDAARIVLLAEQQAPLPSLYVVADGHPVVRAEYYAEVARLLGAPAPRFTSPPDDSPSAARARADKRLSVGKLQAELRPRLEYPSYREGLAAIVAEAR